jgi:hypothetical protein
LDITRFGAALLLSIQVLFESAEIARACGNAACVKLLPDIVVVNLFNFRADNRRQGSSWREFQELFMISLHRSPEVPIRQGMKAFGSYF